MQSKNPEVLIVGAGPCGLMLALELGRRGINVEVVDQDSCVATSPQANATQARSMEHFRRHGFSEEIRAQGMPADHPTDVAYFTTFAGYELARHKMPASGQAADYVRANSHIWNGPELPHRVPQSIVEQTLYARADALENVEISFNWRADGFEDKGDCVIAKITHVETGAVRQVSAQYLIGADGASSGIRKQLDIHYAGAEPSKRDFMGGNMLSIYLDAPAFYDLKIPPAWMYWTFNKRRRALLATVDGKGRFVLQTQLRAGENIEDVNAEFAGALFLQAVGRSIPFEVTGWASWLAGRALVAQSYGRGRVLLGGDAVHLFTPTGGMGYNTAIEDAVNLGWKLASVLRGHADPGLLGSYEEERLPAAQRNTRFALQFADSIGLYVPSPAVENQDGAGDASRARAGAYLAQHAAHEFTIPGFTFGARYDGSAVIVSDESPAPPDVPSVYVPSAKPGGRAPHAWLEDGCSLFDRFGFDWTLVSFAPDHPSTAIFRLAAAQRGINLECLELADELVARDLYETELALIRPDQIVAWRGDQADRTEVTAIFDQVLGFSGVASSAIRGDMSAPASSS